jgi:hypothetical protein
MKLHVVMTRYWMFLTVFCLLIVVHLLGFRYLLSHVRLSSAVLVSAVLVAIKYLGLFGPVYAFFRRRPRN